MKLKKIVSILITKKIKIPIKEIKEIIKEIKEFNRNKRNSGCFEQELIIEGTEFSQCPKALYINTCKFSSEFSKFSKFKNFIFQPYGIPGVYIPRNFCNVNNLILINIESSLILFLKMPNFFVHQFVKIFNYKWKRFELFLWGSGRKSSTEYFYLYFNFYSVILYILTLTVLKKYKT